MNVISIQFCVQFTLPSLSLEFTIKSVAFISPDKGEVQFRNHHELVRLEEDFTVPDISGSDKKQPSKTTVLPWSVQPKQHRRRKRFRRFGSLWKPWR